MPSGAQAPRPAASSPTLNRISVYLRCLRLLLDEGLERISSKDLALRFDLSATQIRKDLAQFGEFGVRGVGYRVNTLIARLECLLDLDRDHRVVVIGLGNLGRALVRFLGSYRSPFRVAALVDHDPEIIGTKLYGRVVPAMMRLVVSASTTQRFENAVPYHSIEKPRKSLACRPALKLNSTMMPMGTYRKR